MHHLRKVREDGGRHCTCLPLTGMDRRMQTERFREHTGPPATYTTHLRTCLPCLPATTYYGLGWELAGMATAWKNWRRSQQLSSSEVAGCVHVCAAWMDGFPSQCHPLLYIAASMALHLVSPCHLRVGACQNTRPALATGGAHAHSPTVTAL